MLLFFRQEISFCDTTYENLGYPCSSRCDQWTGGNSGDVASRNAWCGDEAYDLPDWMDYEDETMDGRYLTKEESEELVKDWVERMRKYGALKVLD